MAQEDEAASLNTTVFVCMFGLFLFSFLIYARSISFHFVNWDDDTFIYKNPAVIPPSWQNIKYVWSNSYLDIYLPLLPTIENLLVWVAQKMGPAHDVILNGTALNPEIFHLANVLFHAANAAVLYALLIKQTKHVLGSLVGAALFALHPLNVETVAWCSALDHDICALFEFVALYLYVSHAQNSSSNNPNFKWGYFGAVFFGVLAMFVMPIAVVLPVTAFIIDIIILHRPFKKASLECGAWLLLVAPFVLVALQVKSQVTGFAVPIWQRLFAAGDALAFYVTKLIAPINLTYDYGRTPSLVMNHWWGYATWLVPVAIISVGIRYRKRYPWLMAGILIFFVNILPTSGLVLFPYQHYSTVADRYEYLAIPGISLILAFWIAQLVNPIKVVPAICLVLVCYLCLTEVQLNFWRSSITLYNHEIAINPESRSVYPNYGEILMETGRLEAAERMYIKGIAADPQSPIGYYGLAHAYELLNDPKDAILNYKLSIEKDFRLTYGHLALANVYRTAGDFPDALNEYRIVETQDSTSVFAHLEIAKIVQTNGQNAEAISEYRKAISLDPKLDQAHENLGIALAQSGDSKNSIGEFQTAVTLSPKNASYRRNLARILIMNGDKAKASDELLALLSQNPDDQAAKAMLGSLRGK